MWWENYRTSKCFYIQKDFFDYFKERLATFFENMGWKVFTVPETATVLLGGGVKFSELNIEQMFSFQKDLLLTLLQIEKVKI